MPRGLEALPLPCLLFLVCTAPNPTRELASGCGSWGELASWDSSVTFCGAHSSWIARGRRWNSVCRPGLCCSVPSRSPVSHASAYHDTFGSCRGGPLESATVEDVLVVGGAGYVGSILTRQLLNAGYRVRVLDLQLFGLSSLEEIQGHRRLEIQTGDFRNVEHVVRALRGMDAVVHLAAIVGDPACALDEDTTIAVNYEAAKMMAELARANGISRFIFASTCSVYGDGSAHDLIDEQGELNPVSLYATTKIDAEQALREVADEVFQPTMLRFGTAYGLSHRPRFDLVANLFSAKAVTDGTITVFNGHFSRPFIHVRDMARAIVLAIEAPLHKVGNQVFNVGDSSQNYTIAELGRMISELVPGTHVEESRNNDDPRSYRVSFDKIRNTLGFRASLDVKEGVREMVEAVREGRVGDWHDPIYSNQQEMQRTGLQILKFPDPLKQPENQMSATRQFLRRAA